MKKKKLLTDRSGNLEDKILAEKAQELANAMDREILWGMLENLGWTRVMVPYNNNLHINTWTAKNCKGAYEYYDRDYIFEDAKDANWFKLKWLS